MSNTVTIKNTALTENELITLIENKGGKITVREEKKKGRPLQYENKEEYVKMRNKMTKFRNMTLEKAKQQRDRYVSLLKDLNEFIDSKTEEPLVRQALVPVSTQ